MSVADRQPGSGDSIVVVGGGPCASIAARELVRAGHQVTMLDAGRRSPRGLTVHMAGRTVFRFVEPGHVQVNRQRSAVDPNTEWRSSLSLGGLSNYWTGAVPRFAPDDFTAGESVDERFLWPIRYDDLVPFYELAEDDLCITAGDDFANIPAGRARYRYRPPADWAAIAATAAEHGDSMGPIPIAKGSRWMVAARPREFTSYHSILKPIRNSPNLTVVQHAHVIRINDAPASGGAESVTFVDTRSGELRTLHGRAFVIAAGTLDSTEILLRSVSDGFPHGLGNAHGILGRYLHDHPKEWWPATLAAPLTALYHPMYVSRDDVEPDHPLSAASLTFGLASGKDRLATFANRAVARLGVQVFGTMVPNETTRVSLAPGHDPDDPASALEIDLRFDDAAVATLHRARERATRIFAGAGNPIEIGPFHDLAPGSSYHLGGTIRMHDRPEFGMVDRWNRIHDVPNVVVCDASTFTTSPEKNPTLTAMAIAARAARHLATS